jgi:hypothetical protein
MPRCLCSARCIIEVAAPDRSGRGDIAEMIVVAHPERKLEMGHYKDSAKLVAEERFSRYHNVEPKRIFV